MRVLLVSGSIGLGHAGRDLAIARELRALDPDVEIAWLAGDPARRLLAEAGENLLPESDLLDETACAEQAGGGFSLNILAYARAARSAWRSAVRAYLAACRRFPHDVLVGDETYELVFAQEDTPDLIRTPFAVIYDFVGLDAMGSHPGEHFAAYMANRAWSGGRHGRPPRQDLVLFVGEPADVPDKRFGPLLPNRRGYARSHYRFVGYVLPFDPSDYSDRPHLRSQLGYGSGPLVLCSAGGTAVGVDLLRLCAAAAEPLRAAVPAAQLVLVAGPRIHPASVRAPRGVRVVGFVPRLYEHLAAADAAVVQAGGTTTLELTALRTPFAYFPLADHFEQNLVVAKRLERHRAGHRLDFSATDPASLAETIRGMLLEDAGWPPIPTDGARVAARLIKALAPVPTTHAAAA